MGVWLGPRGKPKAKQLPKFTYTGSYERLYTTRQDGTVDWELVLKTSGTLTFQKVVPSVDVFLCGPGANGGSAYHNQSTNQYVGGNGGAGGETASYNAIPVTAGTAYGITVGTTGTATSGFGKSAASGGGEGGGTGAYTNNNIESGGNSTPGTQGALAFGGTTLYNNGYRYGAGGGGGGSLNNINFPKYESAGGASGGGAGGVARREGVGVAGSGAENSGGGGGGGAADRPNWSFNGGGSGGSGIIIIRNARS